jgi:hypothetical protein
MNIILNTEKSYKLTELAQAVQASNDDLLYIVQTIDGQEVSIAIRRDVFLAGVGGQLNIQKDGALIGSTSEINFIEGTDITITAVQNLDGSIDITINNNAGGGAVDSVNGQTGIVVLDASDVNAYPDNNPSNFIDAAGAPVQSVAGKTGTVTLDKSDVGLGNVDNTSDTNKPISSATQTALNGKQPLATVLTNTTASFTTTLETKLNGIESGAEVNNISDSNATDLTDGGDTTLHTHDGRYYTEAQVDTLISGRQPLATVLTNTTAAFTTTQETKLSGIESGAEVNNISDANATDLTDGGDTTLHTHDGRYYTESEIDTLLSGKQATLISGTNIKTVNGVTLLGSGNIPVTPGELTWKIDDLSGAAPAFTILNLDSGGSWATTVQVLLSTQSLNGNVINWVAFNRTQNATKAMILKIMDTNDPTIFGVYSIAVGGWLANLGVQPYAPINVTYLDGNGVPSTIVGSKYTASITIIGDTGPTGPAGTTTFAGLTGVPSDNAALLSALDAKENSSSVDSLIFGTAEDGDATITTASQTAGTWLTSGVMVRDAYLNDLTFTGVGAIRTGSYKLHVRGILNLENAGADAIRTTAPNAGGNASGTGAGAQPGAQTGVTLGLGDRGQAGVTGGTTAGTQAGTYTPAATLTGGITSTSGKGGNAGVNNGGAVRTTAATVRNRISTIRTEFLRGIALLLGGAGGPAGGSGAGDSTAGGGSGAGGNGGGIIAIFARTIARGGSTAASCINSVGGAGGNGGVPAGGNRGGGGGGAGGCGGVVYIVYRFLTGTAATNAVAVNGGAGGNGGNATGTGIGGDGGGSGQSGVAYLQNIEAGTVTLLESVNGTLGSAGVGAVGGSGAVANVQRINL